MRDRSNEINMLQDTLQILRQGWYRKSGKTIQLKLSGKEMEKIQVYLPDEVKRYVGCKDFKLSCVPGGHCVHSCVNIGAYELDRKRMKEEFFTERWPGVLVLNFANPVNPGGGVRKGARAQEEDLCRKSSLLLSLESKEAQRYYRYNRRLGTYMGSDALMITPQVEIIRDESGKLLDRRYYEGCSAGAQKTVLCGYGGA